MTGAADFTKLVPGFDFLQSLMKGAGAGLPNMGQWIAPTLNPEELDKRIGELRTVQFWLEQNARMLGATIQALEVQRMTLSTLQTMNLPLEQLRDAMTLRMPEAEAPAPAPAPATAPPPEPAPEPTPAPPAAAASAPAIAPALGTVDPMQWWGALTKQFTELAASALKDVASEAPVPELAGTKTPVKKAAGKSAGTSAKTSPKTSAKTPARKAATAPGPRRRGGG
jgi:hypothetical protein